MFESSLIGNQRNYADERLKIKLKYMAPLKIQLKNTSKTWCRVQSSCLLWNHSFSWVPMFVNCKNLTGSLGHNFVGNFLFCITKQDNYMISLMVRVDVNL